MVVASFHLVRFGGRDALRRLALVPFDRRRLARTPGLRFGKLLGTGRGRTMTTSADLRRWAVFATWDDRSDLDRFVASGIPDAGWDRALERYDVVLDPIGAHGSWDGVDPLGGLTVDAPRDDGRVAVLTRATVRTRRLRAFLSAVPPIDRVVPDAAGLLAAVAVGEVPVGRQATFSLWRDAAAVQAFAYRSPAHADAVERTRAEAWYAEEWFARFRPVASSGTWDGLDPLDPLDPGEV